MDKNDLYVSVRFVSDGICQEYNFTFEIFENDNIEIYFGDELQDKGFQVSIDKIEVGGKVVFDKAPSEGTVITIIRRLPIKRTTDFKEGGPFRASKVNHEFNYQLACIEQVSEKLNRVFCLPPYLGKIDLTLPIPEAGKSLIWDNEGVALENSNISINDLNDTFEQAKTLYQDSQAALEALDLQTIKIDNFINKAEYIEEKVEDLKVITNSKSNIDFSNTDMNDFVVEYWHDEENLSWYRKYKSGWIEQGGYIESGFSVTFPLPFSERCYGAQLVAVSTAAQGYVMYLSTIPTLTSLTGRRNSSAAIPFVWVAYGK